MKLPCKKAITLSLLALLAVKSAPALSATIYASLASFDSALGSPSPIVDNFNDFTTFTVPSFPLDRGPYTLGNAVPSVFANGGGSTNNVDGTGQLGIGSESFDTFPSITLFFDAPVLAVAFDSARRNTDPTQSLLIDAVGLAHNLAVERPTFFGVIFNSPVNSLTITQGTSGVDSDIIGVDNLRFVNAPVPAPSLPLLFGLGLVVIHLRRRLASSQDARTRCTRELFGCREVDTRSPWSGG